jgi:hypothetical protein
VKVGNSTRLCPSGESFCSYKTNVITAKLETAFEVFREVLIPPEELSIVVGLIKGNIFN